MKETLVRWGKFNAVGAMGMVVQLTALALLNKLLGGRYLVASTLAVELTLLHNFLWHERFTWRDRSGARFRRLMRFHLSSGAVSMAGNLLLMRAFVQGAHLPVVIANLMAILCCSALNFLLAEWWSFGESAPA